MVRAGADGSPDPTAPPTVGTYRVLLRNREFVGLLVSGGISLIGDQVARVALTVLVFERTGDPLLSAVAYAATWLPACLGPLLSGIADRVPRRRVLIGTDLLRALILGVMVLPGMGWGALVAMVSLVTLLEGPARAARVPLLRETLQGEAAFRLGSGVDESVQQQGVTLGFLAAGATLAAVGPRACLLIDAASFLLSALLIRALVAASQPAAPAVPTARSIRDLVACVTSDVRIGWSAATAPGPRRPLLVCWIAASAVIAPEALIAPWARTLGAGATMIGVLYAAPAFGCVAVLPLVGRVSAGRAERLLFPLVGLSLLPLLLCGADIPLAVAILTLAVSGAGASFTVLTRVQFLRHIGDDVAGRAYGIAAAGLYAGQGAVVLLAGALGRQLGPGHTIAVLACGGAVGVAAVIALTDAGPEIHEFSASSNPAAVPKESLVAVR
jgi:predicted MFS family arabinose efflux permease